MGACSKYEFHLTLVAPSTVIPKALARDVSGNLYLTVDQQNNLATSITLSNVTVNHAHLLVSMTPSGSVRWFKTLGTPSSSIRLSQMIADPLSNDIFFVGTYTGNEFIDHFHLNSTDSTISNSFWGRMSSSGSIQWIRTTNGTRDCVLNSISLDGETFYILGSYIGICNYSSEYSVTNTAFALYDSVVSQHFVSNGTVTRIRSIGDTASADNAYQVESSGGSVFIAGKTAFAFTIDSVNILRGGYIMAMNSFLIVQKSFAFETTGTFGLSMDVENGRIGFGGYVFGAVTVNGTLYPPVSSTDIFMGSLTTSLEFTWFKKFGGSSLDFIWDTISIDATGNLFLTGDFSNTITFGPYTLTSAGDTDVFVVAVDPLGNTLWTNRYGGIGTDSGWNLQVIDVKTVVITGYFQGNVSFDGLWISTPSPSDQNTFVGLITVASCYGFPNSNPSVCGSRGICNADGTCSCPTGYSGLTCEFSSCFGFNSTSTLACSGNGTCVAANQCSCKTGWTGTQCQHHTCFGRSSVDPTVCSSNGTCTTLDTCRCNNGTSGLRCEIVDCLNCNSTRPPQQQDYTAIILASVLTPILFCCCLSIFLILVVITLWAIGRQRLIKFYTPCLEDLGCFGLIDFLNGNQRERIVNP